MHERGPNNNQDQKKTGIVRPLLIAGAILFIALWLYLTPEGLLGKSDAVGYAVCHRIDLRSFNLGERALPLCSRCTGMYLGALFTLLAFLFFRKTAASYPRRSIQIVLILFAGIWALDGLNSFLSLLPEASSLYTPQNWLRLITGTLIGVSLTTLIYPVLIQTAWKDSDPSAVIPSWGWFVGLLSFLGIVILGILSDNPMILYPLALLSSVGVLALLTMTYTVLVLTVFRYQNQTMSWQELWFPLLGGVTLALVQVAVIDLLRYVLTGTWDGFHL